MVIVAFVKSSFLIGGFGVVAFTSGTGVTVADTAGDDSAGSVGFVLFMPSFLLVQSLSAKNNEPTSRSRSVVEGSVMGGA